MCREPCNLLFKCILTIAHNGVEIERTEIYCLNFLAKFRFDTAENEPTKILQNFAKVPLCSRAIARSASLRAARSARRGSGAGSATSCRLWLEVWHEMCLPKQFLSPVFRLSNRETSFEVLKQQIIDSEDKEKEKSEARLSKLKKPKHIRL